MCGKVKHVLQINSYAAHETQNSLNATSKLAGE